jgi:hypothetical protein
MLRISEIKPGNFISKYNIVRNQDFELYQCEQHRLTLQLLPFHHNVSRRIHRHIYMVSNIFFGNTRLSRLDGLSTSQPFTGGCTGGHSIFRKLKWHVIVCCGIGLSAASGVGDVVLPLLSDVGVGDVAIVVAEESKINKVSLPVKKTMNKL